MVKTAEVFFSAGKSRYWIEGRTSGGISDDASDPFARVREDRSVVEVKATAVAGPSPCPTSYGVA